MAILPQGKYHLSNYVLCCYQAQNVLFTYVSRRGKRD